VGQGGGGGQGGRESPAGLTDPTTTPTLRCGGLSGGGRASTQALGGTPHRLEASRAGGRRRTAGGVGVLCSSSTHPPTALLAPPPPAPRCPTRCSRCPSSSPPPSAPTRGTATRWAGAWERKPRCGALRRRRRRRRRRARAAARLRRPWRRAGRAASPLDAGPPLPPQNPPTPQVYSIAADSVFSIPLWRHVFTWIGARPGDTPAGVTGAAGWQISGGDADQRGDRSARVTQTSGVTDQRGDRDTSAGGTPQPEAGAGRGVGAHPNTHAHGHAPTPPQRRPRSSSGC
jgi:hypothetical protein